MNKTVAMKYSVFSFIFFLWLPGKIFAQAPDIEWALCIGGSSWDVAYTVTQSPDSGFIVGGYLWFADGDWSGCEYGKMFLVKLDSSGNIVWKKCYGGTDGGDAIHSVKPTIYGGYIFAANTYSNDGDVSGNHGISDYWVVKIDEAGEIEWQKCYGGTGIDYPFDIIQTIDGGYAVIGYSTSDDGDITGHHPGGTFGLDYWVIKISSDGGLEWEKSLGGSDEDQGFAIAQTADGGYVCAGHSNSDDGDISGDTDDYDYWLVKLDADGNLLWEENFGGSDGDFVYSVKVDDGGSIVLTGHTYSDDGDVTDYHGGLADVWIIKTDSAGNVIRKKCYGGNSWDAGRSIAITSENDYLVGGQSSSNNGDLTAESVEGFWVFKTDSAGVMKWQKSFGGSGLDAGFDAISTYEGGTIIVGHTESNDGDVSGNHGEFDAWVVKLSPDCGHEKYYTDADADGYGNSESYIYSCTDTAGYVSNNLDCNDANLLINPGVKETCNFTDDNCNGETDEGFVYQLLFADADGDGFGNPENDSLFCNVTEGFVYDSTDCDDTNENIYPGAPEIFNAIDDNCDGKIDEGVSVDDVQKTAFSIYPNPTDGNIFLASNFASYKNISVEITDLNGRALLKAEITASQQLLQTNSLASGRYIISVKQNDVVIFSEGFAKE